MLSEHIKECVNSGWEGILKYIFKIHFWFRFKSEVNPFILNV